MSRLAIKRLLPAGPIHLELKRRQLDVRQGKIAKSFPLASPLKAGLPTSGQLTELRAGLEGLFASWPNGKRRLDITVSDALARCWIVERVSGLASQQEILALAERQMQDIYGCGQDESGQWVARIDATPFATSWPAMALPKALLDLLVELATGKGWTVGNVQTSFVSAFNARRANPLRRPGQEVYALDSREGLTIAIRDKTQWRTLRTYPPLKLLGTDLPAMLRRDCRAAGLQLDDCRIEQLSGHGTAATALRLDFSPVREESPLRLGLSTVTLALLLAIAWSLTSETEAGPPSHYTSLPSAEEVSAINVATAELNFPWAQVLDLVESSVDDSLRITRFEADARDGRLDCHGVARDSHAVLDLPGRLRANALVADARVLSQSPVDATSSGDFPIRFALEVALSVAGTGTP